MAATVSEHQRQRALRLLLVARLEDREFEAIRFGDEGQYWRLMEVDAYLAHAMAVPYLQSRLGDYLRERRRIGE